MNEHEAATSSRRMVARGWLETPEVNLAFFSFLLHFVWEMWQVPFFAAMPSTSHWSGVAICTQATFGDAAMAVFALWVAALPRRLRRWFFAPSRSEVALYLGTGLALTVAFEWLATGPLGRWSYAPEMPTLPLLGTGLLPVLQWIVLPPIALWLTARQLRGGTTLTGGRNGPFRSTGDET